MLKMAGTAVQGNKTSSSSPVPNPNVTASNPNAGDLFSPTSAAAWALSTLHNFGAAAPNDGSRPTADSLTGTRLFNNTARADSTTIPSMTSEPNQLGLVSTSGMLTAPSHAVTTTGVTWGQPHFQHHNNVSSILCHLEVIQTVTVETSVGSFILNSNLLIMNLNFSRILVM